MGRKPRYIELDGFRLPESFELESFRSGCSYEPREEDVVVATYPKCGTTWMCQIVLLLLRRGRPLTSKEDYFGSCPFLEYSGAPSAENLTRPGCIKTHLPLDRLKGFSSGKAKYVFVARRPEDCLVSFYNHAKFFPLYRFTGGALDDFFELFVNGRVDFNDYFDHLLSWYERRNDPNVLFTTFETMKADHKSTVLRVAEFLGGQPLVAELLENGGELLRQVLQYSGFEYMRTEVNAIFTDAYLNPDESSGKLYEVNKAAKEDGHRSEGSFVRKGEVGEGRTVLSDDQKRRLHERIREKTAHTDVMATLWGNDAF